MDSAHAIRSFIKDGGKHVAEEERYVAKYPADRALLNHCYVGYVFHLSTDLPPWECHPLDGKVFAHCTQTHLASAIAAGSRRRARWKVWLVGSLADLQH